MRIGFLIYGSLDTLSGGYLYDRMLVDYLRTQGDTVEVISLPWRNYASHLTDNLRFRLSSNLDILIQDELCHPSLIHANAGKRPHPVISLVHHLRCSELRPKWQNYFYRVIEKKYLESVDGFIFNSQTTKNVVIGIADHGKPSIVAYPPTDRFGAVIPEDEIVERAQRKELRILFLGNIIERKGLHTLIEAVEDLKPKVGVDVVGSLTTDPAYVKSVQEHVTVQGLSSIVHFHGPLNEEPLRQKLRQAHILVVPSSYEGFGIVYIEGMGFGLPAIGTTAGAASEIIEEGETGYLIEPGDSVALASRLAGLWADRGLLTRISLQARQRYLHQPKWEQTAGQIRDFLLKQIESFSV